MGVLQYMAQKRSECNKKPHGCRLSLPAGENEMVIMRPGNKYEYKFGFELPQG